MDKNNKYYYLTSFEQINIHLHLKQKFKDYKWILLVDSDDLEEVCKKFSWEYERIYIDYQINQV
mgnify:CR=1 FL=1